MRCPPERHGPDRRCARCQPVDQLHPYVAGGQVPVDEAPAATSLAAGAIARSVDDAHAAYRARLARAVADMHEASTVQT